MRAADLRPELPHASRDAIGVIIQFGLRAQGHDVLDRGARETNQVQLLSADNGCEDLPDDPQIGGGQSSEQRQAGLGLFQEGAFGGRSLPTRQVAEVQRCLSRAQNSLTEGLQSRLSPFQRH